MNGEDDRPPTRALTEDECWRRIEEAPYGRIAMLADPFGHGFCMIEMNAKGYDALL